MAISKVGLTTGITGTLPVANGGTGLASGTTDQFLKFTGTTTLASAADNTGGLTLISTHTESSGSAGTIDMNGVFTSSYDRYRVNVDQFNMASPSTLLMQLGSGGTVATGIYQFVGLGFRSDNTEIRGNTNSATAINLQAGTGSDYQSNTPAGTPTAFVEITNPFNAMYTNVMGQCVWANGVDEDAHINNIGCNIKNTTSYTDLRFLCTSGNIQNSTVIRVYGYNK